MRGEDSITRFFGILCVPEEVENGVFFCGFVIFFVQKLSKFVIFFKNYAMTVARNFF